MSNLLQRSLAFMAWVTAQMNEKPEWFLASAERFMRDPNLLRVRALTEERVGTLPVGKKTGEYTWGVARDATCWRLDSDGRAFTFGDYHFGVDATRKLNVTITDNIVVVEEMDLVRCLDGAEGLVKRSIIRYDPSDGWVVEDLALTAVVRRDSIVRNMPDGVVEESVCSYVRTTLINEPCDGIMGDEHSLVAWRRDYAGVRFIFLYGDRRTEYHVAAVEMVATIPPIAFAGDGHGAPGVTVVVRGGTSDRVLVHDDHAGFSVVGLRQDVEVVRAFVLDGNVWAWRQRGERSWIAVNGTVQEEIARYVCDVRRVGKWVAVNVKNGAMRQATSCAHGVVVLDARGVWSGGEVLLVANAHLDAWPYVPCEGGYGWFVVHEDGTLEASRRVRGSWKEIRVDDDGTVWLVSTQASDGACTISGRKAGNEWVSLSTHGAVRIATAAWSPSGRIIVAANGVDGKARLIGPMGEVSLRGYDSIQDVVVHAGRVTFLARDGITVLRVTLPLLGAE